MIHLHEEAARCLLCADAPCSQACKNADPSRAIRAIRFGNEAIARQWVALADVFYKTICLQEIREVSPRVNGSRCVGCLLCRLVCPTRAISPAKRVQKKSR